MDAWGGSWGNSWGESWGFLTTGGGSGGPSKGKGRHGEAAFIAPFIKWTRRKKKEAEDQGAVVLETQTVPVQAPIVPETGPALIAPIDFEIFNDAYAAHAAEINSIATIAGQMHRLLEIIEAQLAEQDDEDVLTLLLN